MFDVSEPHTGCKEFVCGFENVKCIFHTSSLVTFHFFIFMPDQTTFCCTRDYGTHLYAVNSTRIGWRLGAQAQTLTNHREGLREEISLNLSVLLLTFKRDFFPLGTSQAFPTRTKHHRMLCLEQCYSFVQLLKELCCSASVA